MANQTEGIIKEFFPLSWNFCLILKSLVREAITIGNPVKSGKRQDWFTLPWNLETIFKKKIFFLITFSKYISIFDWNPFFFKMATFATYGFVQWQKFVVLHFYCIGNILSISLKHYASALPPYYYLLHNESWIQH